MAQHWKQWCRLCACEEPNISHINVFQEGEQASQLVDAINKFFSVNITREDEWSQVICSGCHHLVNSIIYFAQRTSKVQEMFAELYNGSEEVDTEEVKLHFKLNESHDNEIDLKLLGNCLTEQSFEANTVLYAKDTLNFDTPRIKTELVDEDDIEMRENECRDSISSHESYSDGASTKTEDSDSDSDYYLPKTRKRKPLTRRKVEKPFNCSKCGRGYKQFFSYRDHMQYEHDIAVDVPHFPCTECNKTFATATRLQEHQSTHILLEQEKNIPCKHCKEMFSSEKEVQEHIRAVRMNDKMIICTECGGRYKTSSSLKAHMLTHAKERLFKCSSCDKSFKSKVSLKRHEDIHNDTKYICPTCGIELNTQRTLKRHMVVHSDVKRYKCDFCGNEYKRAKTLKSHLILHTGLRPYKCNFCKKSFVSGSNCRSHKKRMHPVEFAAMEAAGTKIVTTNVPNLQYLRSVTFNNVKSPVGKQTAI